MNADKLADALFDDIRSCLDNVATECRARGRDDSRFIRLMARMAALAEHDAQPAQGLPDIADLTKKLGMPDTAFDAWRSSVPDKHWVKRDLSALRIGYELGRSIQPAQAAQQVKDDGTAFIDGMGWVVRCSDAIAYAAKLVATSQAAQPETEQAAECAVWHKHKHTPLRIDAMGGYVCLTCIDQKLVALLAQAAQPKLGDFDARDSFSVQTDTTTLQRNTAQPVGDSELRFFVDHGVIHDRKRGRHVLGSENDAAVFGEPLQDTVDALNAMEAATRDAGGLRESYLDECRAQAQPVGVPDGWKMVPVKATREMIAAGKMVGGSHGMEAAWNDMLSAAPQPPAQPSADAEEGCRGYCCPACGRCYTCHRRALECIDAARAAEGGE